MPESEDYLRSLKIAAPCQVSWDSMEGDERVRHCGSCNKNVYNVSNMTGVEANKFLQLTAAKACVRFYQRADGTILVDNCPAGLRLLRNRWRKIAASISTLIGLAQGIFLSAFAQELSKSLDESAAPGPAQISKPPLQLDGLNGKHSYPVQGELLPTVSIIDHRAAADPALKSYKIAFESYKHSVEIALAIVIPHNLDIGNAALSICIDSNGKLTGEFVNNSPSKAVDDQILDAMKSVKLSPPPQPPANYKPFPLYFECRSGKFY